MGNNMALQTSGFEELIQSLEKAGKDSRRAAERALKNGKKAITPGIREAIARHRRTGRTEASLDQKDEVNWEGTVAEANIGFRIRDGGLPSIFLMYGTPRMAPDKRLLDSVYGSAARKKFNQAAEEALARLMREDLGG